MGRTPLGVVLLVAMLAPGVSAQPERGASDVRSPPRCTDALGRTPTIEAGREREVRALVAPHEAGQPVAKTGWTLRDIRIEQDTIRLRLERASSVATLHLTPALCADPQQSHTLSFALRREAAAGGESAEAAFQALESAIAARDVRPFYRVWVGEPPPPEVDAQPPPPPWQTLALTGWLVLAGLLGLLVGLVGVVRQTSPFDQAASSNRDRMLLAAILLAGAALRLGIEPMFLREAYPLASLGHLDRGVRWAAELTAYPRGQWLLVAGIRPLLPDSPFDAWFLFNAVQGALTIPAAYFATRMLTGRVPVALAAAALLAAWPQHVRFSASESTHVGLVLWAFLAIGWTARAARTGRITDFIAAATSATTMVVMRPEAGLWGPGLIAVGVALAPGIRAALAGPRTALPRVLLVVVLLGLLVPQLQVTAGEATTLGPAAESPEALDMDSLIGLPVSLFTAGPLNAFFDPATSPLWLWPLAWIAVLAARTREARVMSYALMATVVLFFLLYVKMPPAVTLWAMGRYHLAVLPAVVVLSALGLEWIFVRLMSESAARWLPPAACALSLVGVIAWWSPVTAFPMDWQQEQAWLVEAGQKRPRILDAQTRLVTPDNRRRFGDMSPREPIFALGETHRLTEEVVTIEHALSTLNVGGVRTSAIYYEGLYCHLALAPGEMTNPQCDAMHQTFELEPVDALTIDAPPYLLAYADVRPSEPLPIALYRVGARRLPPDQALRLLPRPVEHGDTSSGSLVMGTSTRSSTEPPRPPLNR